MSDSIRVTRIADALIPEELPPTRLRLTAMRVSWLVWTVISQNRVKATDFTRPSNLHLRKSPSKIQVDRGWGTSVNVGLTQPLLSVDR
jgi:hypothetical protein